MISSRLYELIPGFEQIAWAGDTPPDSRWEPVPQVFDSTSGFRAPARLHQKFDAVFLLQHDLGEVKQWPIVIDEALRLIRGTGHLVLRFHDSDLITSFELANLLELWTGQGVELEDWSRHGGATVWTLRVQLPPRPVGVETVTFGVITDGRRNEAIKRFITSIEKLRGFDPTQHEVLVCGPKECSDVVAQHGDHVRLIEQPDRFTRIGWITKKKNLLIEASRHENCLMAHDRYVLPPDFLTNLDDWGGDFSTLVCRQVMSSGKRFPDWVTLGAPWKWATGTLEYTDYHPSVYLNGGLILAKREVLIKTPFSEILMWSQGEDVELTRRLQGLGVVPRVAKTIVVNTEETRPGYVETFQIVPPDPNTYRTVTPPSSTFTGTYSERLGPELEVTFGSPQSLEKSFGAGVLLPGGWAHMPASSQALPGLVWRGKENCFFQLFVGGEPPIDRIELSLVGNRRFDCESIIVNGASARYEVAAERPDRPAILRIEVPDDARNASLVGVEIQRLAREVRISSIAAARILGEPWLIGSGRVFSLPPERQDVELLGAGWMLEQGIVISPSRDADLAFTVDDAVADRFRIKLGVKPVNVGKHQRSRVSVSVNGFPAYLEEFRGTRQRGITVPACRAPSGRSRVLVRVRMDPIAAPSPLLAEADPAIGISHVRLTATRFSP